MTIALTAQANGNAASGSSVTITLPTYSASSYILLIVSSNQANASAYTFNANVSSITEIVNAGGNRRLTAMQVVPNGTGQVNFALTAGQSQVWEWWIASYSGVGAGTIATAANTVGSSTSSTIPCPAVNLTYIATGTELAISAANVNSTATWTTDGNTVFHTTANNGALMVDTASVTASAETVTFASMDRGNNGSSRNQNSISFVLQASGSTPQVNLLSDPSFELGSTLATNWNDEHTTATQATYSIVQTGVVDGANAQKFTYSGVSADAGVAKTEIYQAPVTGMSPGDTLQFSLWLSGSLTNAYCFIGVEAFNSGNTYISESDSAAITTLSGTPTQYMVTYVCPPGTDHVAVYLQAPEIGATSVLSITMDKAALVDLGKLTQPSGFMVFM